MAAASLVQVGGRHDQIVVCQHHCIISADLRSGQDRGYWTAGRKICERTGSAPPARLHAMSIAHLLPDALPMQRLVQQGPLGPAR
jgi:hypothetical protein